MTQPHQLLPRQFVRLAWRGVPLSLASVLLLGLLGGCETTRPTATPALAAMALPAQFRNALPEPLPAPVPGAASAGATQKELAPLSSERPVSAEAAWWRAFGSPELDGLVDRALANNADLRIATLQVAQAKIRSDQVVAGGKPIFSAPLKSAIQSPAGQVGAVPVSGGGGATQRSYQASIQGTWRPDVWGEQRALEESSDLQVWRAVYERENVQRNLIAGVAMAYVGYLTANDGLNLARQSEAIGLDIIKTSERRVNAGDATIDDLEQKRAALFALREVIPTLEQQREESRNTLAYLVGSVPGAMELPDTGLASLAQPEVARTLPSAVLLQRPDIRMVEARLRAANADIDVARARLMPPVDLSAQAGFSSLALAQLLTPQSFFWNAIAGIAVNIFDGGKKEADKAYSQAYQEEMVATYARTVLQAVREVEGALSGLRANSSRLQEKRGALQAGRTLYTTSDRAFAAGAMDLSSLLEAKKTYQRYLEDEQRFKGEYLKSYISLYQAVGGDALADDRPARGPQRAADGGAMVLAEPGAASRGAGPWQVELAGVYHQTVVSSVWRDLKGRYPSLMQAHAVKALRTGYIEERSDVKESWYRVYVTDFGAKEEADRFCAQLQAVQQQCSAGLQVAAEGKEGLFGARTSRLQDGPAQSARLLAKVP